MERTLLDLRLALRRLRQNPGFAAVAILTLALGIGANTATFSAINAVIFRSLPVDKPSEIVTLNETLGGNPMPTLSYPNYRDVRDRNSVFSGVIGFQILPVSLGLPGASQRVWGYMVTGNYFQTLGVSAIQGRAFTAEDDVKPGGHPLVVLSYPCWQKRFGGDPGAVGRVVKVNGMDFTVLGVMPRGFFGTEIFYMPEVFFPMMMQKELEGGAGNLEARANSNTFVDARLKPGVTMAQAEAGVNSVARQLSEEYPKDDGGMKVVLTPPGLAGNYLRGAAVGFATVLFGVSSLVLLVACTNLASMLLARASDRRKETAIRLALGAERWRLVRQLLTESMVVALVGGAIGALLARWITMLLAAWRPPIDIPILVNITPDYRVFLFALLVSMFTIALFGLLPAWQSTKTDLVPALKNEAATERQRRWHLRDYMVATQIALSTLLLVCSVLVVKSLQKAFDAPIGYEARGAVTVSYDLNIQGYKQPQGREFHRRLLEKVRAIPGIESAAMVDIPQLALNTSSSSIFIEGKPRPKPAEAPIAYEYSITPDYFHTMKTRLLSGREFDLRDKRDATQVAIVNKAFADKFFPGENPMGKRFFRGTSREPTQIVGVVQDGKYFSLSEKRETAFWTPLEVFYSPVVALMARTNLNSNEALRAIRGAVRELDPNVALYATGSLVEMLDIPLLPARLAASALGVFGALAAILAATGIYGVMAYAVSRRAREIGIRMAIGASQGQVLSMIARRAVILIGSGTVIGLAAAFGLGRLIEQILYGVEPTDPVTYAVVFAMMLAIALLACWIPAQRAIRIDPMRSLRQE